MRPGRPCARRRRAPGPGAGTPRRLRCPAGAGGCRWPRWSATGPAAGAGCSTPIRVHRRRAGERRSFSEDDYAALIAAAHAQLTAPIILTGGRDPFWGVMADGVDAVVGAVRGQVSAGAGVIKTAATGGAYGREDGEEIGQSELSAAELAALTAEAHRFGRRVAAHALGTEGIANAVAAGVDTIEHGVFLTEELVARMSAQGTVLCPTVQIYRVIASGGGGEVPEYARVKAERVVAAHEESVRMALSAGVPVVAGTDAGSVMLPHPALVSELRALRSCGMSGADVLRAATSRAAETLGSPGAGRGVISPGARADLLLVD